MRRYITLPTAEILNLDFSQQWQITPFMTASLNEQSIDDVVWNEDFTEGAISYDTLDLDSPHTYNYIDPVSGKLNPHKMEKGVHGRPKWVDPVKMKEITKAEIDEFLKTLPAWNEGDEYNEGENIHYSEKVFMVNQRHISDTSPETDKTKYREVIPNISKKT